MTFKDLQKLLQSQRIEPGPKLLRSRDKPYWYWERTRHAEKHKANKGRCCFNHIIGLPTKDGKRLPMFDYEGLLYKSLIEPGYLNSTTSGTLAHPSSLSICGLRKQPVLVLRVHVKLHGLALLA